VTSLRLRSAIAVAAIVYGLFVTEPVRAQSKAPPLPPTFTCIADPSGIIDFQGQLGTAGGTSNVKIFPSTDTSELYVDSISSQLGTDTAVQKRITSVSELNDIVRREEKIPAMLAQAHTAAVVAGNFKCLGFSPGRYIFLSEIYGGRGHVGDGQSAIVYYRADVDVSSIKHHAIVVVRGFRRIGSYPPGS